MVSRVIKKVKIENIDLIELDYSLDKFWIDFVIFTTDPEGQQQAICLTENNLLNLINKIEINNLINDRIIDVTYYEYNINILYIEKYTNKKKNLYISYKDLNLIHNEFKKFKFDVFLLYGAN